MAREGEKEKRARGLFPARPTSGKTPLIGTWLPVGATDSAGGGREAELLCLHDGGCGGGGSDSGGGDGEGRRRWWLQRGKEATTPGWKTEKREGWAAEGGGKGGERARSAHSVTLTGKPY